MSMFTLYLFVILDNISIFFGIIIAVSIFAIIGLSIYYAMEVDGYNSKEENDKIRNMVKKWNMLFIKIGFVSLVITVFLPSTKQMAFIYIVGKVSQNEQVQQVPDKALKILNLKLDEYIKDIEGDIIKPSK